VFTKQDFITTPVCYLYQGLAAKYPDIKSDHGMALLLMRGDVWRNEAKEVRKMSPISLSEEGSESGHLVV
jgi:hypothetical protein